jgi:flagellar hook-length control protein FliK
VLVADDAVRRMIESQLPELRQRLEAAGVNVQALDIATDPNTGGSRNPYQTESAPEFAPRTAAAPAPRARINRADAGSLDVTV